MRRVAAVLSVVALGFMGLATTSASASTAQKRDDGDRYKQICQDREGLLADLSPLAYACLFEGNRGQARGLAERACDKKHGAFVDVSPLAYACVLPGHAHKLLRRLLPDAKKYDRVCENRAGLLVDVSPLIYACVFSDPLNQARDRAKQVCQRTEHGLFLDLSPLLYTCVLPGDEQRGLLDGLLWARDHGPSDGPEPPLLHDLLAEIAGTSGGSQNGGLLPGLIGGPGDGPGLLGALLGGPGDGGSGDDGNSGGGGLLGGLLYGAPGRSLSASLSALLHL